MSEKLPEKIQKVNIEGAEGVHDLIVGACITRDDVDAEGSATREYLLVRKDASGQWYFPGGKVREGETVEDALKREVKEELGLVYGEDYSAEFGKPTAGAYNIKDKNLAIINLTIPTDALRKKEPQPQSNDAIKAMLWTADPLRYDLTPQVRDVLEAKMGIIRPLGQSKITNTSDER